MHYTEEDLILYYYGEHRRRAQVERHLAECAACAVSYREVTRSLELIGQPEVPERGDDYGRDVWQRIRYKLPEQEPQWWAMWIGPQRLALACGVAVLVLAAFVAGRTWPAPPGGRGTIQAGRAATTQPAGAGAESPGGTSDAGERVRLAAVGDHLERSERMLLDIVNAAGADQLDVTSQQEWAGDLIAANRLYRDASVAAGDQPVAAILDELERNLLEIVNGPATLTAADVEQLRIRLDAAALLFRVRVLSDELRERELAAATPRKTT